ncbi:MAG TPA: hypothetical protein PKC67_15580 [Kiritimatiellia bacterium]|nr:hypothetical protein [Kiritimatiellia bacterium]HMP35756.1 hypothetical protein [Kiritimatiellia bacterium]
MNVGADRFSSVKRFALALAAGVLLPLAAPGQTSVWNTMTLYGNFNNFLPDWNNMVLVSNNTWELTTALSGSRTNWFKFSANGTYAANWGLSGTQTNFATPMAAIGSQNGNDIYLREITEGRYRFRFNNSTLQYWVDYLGPVPMVTNLLKNPGFESPGSSEFDALHWERGRPDIHGDNWGNSFREDYRFRSGQWMGAVGADPVNFGGWYQEVPFTQDYTYRFDGYFYIDPNWTAAVQEVKVEFFNNAYRLLGQASLPLTGLTNSWLLRSFTAPAPASSTWARTVINVSGAGTKGTLEFDDLSVTALPSPSQSFDTWNFPNPGRHARGGWLVSTGFVTDDVYSRSFRTMNLKNDTASPTNGGFIQSGLLTNGIGTVTFWYRHGWRNEDESPAASNAVSLRVWTSPDGENWTPFTTLTGLQNDFYQSFTKQLNIPGNAYLRIGHYGGSTNTLMIDDISIEPSSPLTLFQDFDAWPSSATTNGTHTFADWTIRTGRVTTVGAFDTFSALLAPSTNTFTNTITSLLYSNGIGDISFVYARGTNGTGAARFAVQVSSNGTTWQTIDTVEQILDTAYLEYNNSFFFSGPHYLRIANLFPTNTPGSASNLVLLSEGFILNEPPPGWAFISSVSNYTSTGNFGIASPSLRFDSTGDGAVTPILPGQPTNLTFWTRGQSIAANSTLVISGQVAVATNWIEITTLTGLTQIANSGSSQSINLPTNIIRLSFHYIKGSGNLAFDDVRVTGISGASAPAQSLFVDNIFVGRPTEYRSQSFDTWPTQTTYGDYTFQGWRAAIRAIIDNNNAFAGKVARLQITNNIQPFIQSPRLTEGIGTIEFKYRHWTTTPALTLLVQQSANGTNWSTIETISGINSTTYSNYSRYVNSTTSFVVRLLFSNGAERILIDEINITKPLPPATVVIDASISPTTPWTNTPVHILANYSPSFGAANIAMTSFYRVGTSGVFTAIPMAITNFTQFGTVTPIPAQPTNTIVQYYIRATFTGPGANSPVFFPPGGSNSPASYGIPRAAPGSVWINEVKYNDQFSNQGFGEEYDTIALVELAGKANTSMNGWRIQFFEATNVANLTASYTLGPSDVIGDDIGGYGFWYMGSSNIPGVYIVMTNYMYDPLPLGIRVLNEQGFIVDAITFGGTVPGFTAVSANDFDVLPGTSGVSRVGIGTNASMFVWQGEVPNTPGAPNDGQVFGTPPPTTMDPPDLYQVVMSNNVMVMWSVGNTNGWNVMPLVTTNLVAASPVWMPVTPFNSDVPGPTTNRVWFILPTNAPLGIYRLGYDP